MRCLAPRFLNSYLLVMDVLNCVGCARAKILLCLNLTDIKYTSFYRITRNTLKSTLKICSKPTSLILSIT